MNVILIDNKISLAKAHAELLHQDEHKAWYWDVNQSILLDNTKSLIDGVGVNVEPERYQLALVHLSDIKSLGELSERCDRVVIYSGGGKPAHQLYPGIQPPISEEYPIPGPILRKICKLAQVVKSDNEWHKCIERLFNDEPFLAFSLLCEAYLLCDGEPSREVHGITIHAPTALKDWLAPFEINHEDENATNQLAGMIGTGELKTKVTDVLQAVMKEDNNLKSAIEAFLTATSEPSTQL